MDIDDLAVRRPADLELDVVLRALLDEIAQGRVEDRAAFGKDKCLGLCQMEFVPREAVDP